MPRSGGKKGNPTLLIAAGIILVIAGAAAVFPAIPPSPVVLHVAADSGSIVRSAATERSSASGNVTTTSLPPPDPDPTVLTSGPGPLANTTTVTPAPFRTPQGTGPAVPVTGTSQYNYQSPSTGSSQGVPVINATSLAARVHERVNKARQENRRPILSVDPALASIARAHSSDMAAHGYFGHVNLQEMDPTARGAAAGYTCRKDYDTYYTYGIAENIFATYRYGSVLFLGTSAVDHDWKTEEAIADETVDAWMNSPEHRDNILDRGMVREGIGVAISKDDLVFVTQDFC